MTNEQHAWLQSHPDYTTTSAPSAAASAGRCSRHPGQGDGTFVAATRSAPLIDTRDGGFGVGVREIMPGPGEDPRTDFTPRSAGRGSGIGRTRLFRFVWPFSLLYHRRRHHHPRVVLFIDGYGHELHPYRRTCITKPTSTPATPAPTGHRLPRPERQPDADRPDPGQPAVLAQRPQRPRHRHAHRLPGRQHRHPRHRRRRRQQQRHRQPDPRRSAAKVLRRDFADLNQRAAPQVLTSVVIEADRPGQVTLSGAAAGWRDVRTSNAYLDC